MSIGTLNAEEFRMPAALIAEDETSDQDTVTEDQDVDQAEVVEQPTMQTVQQGRDDVLKDVREIVQTPNGPRPRWPYPFGYKNVEYGDTD